MSRAAAVISWLEEKSDRVSPIVIKEVRQVMRGREFNYSFGGSLVAGLAVAFFAAADALTGTGSTGGWAFASLIACLALVGLAVVPLGAFSALRNERMEQTLELITLTSLSPRRIVIGKLLTQAVKLATLFAAIAPFIAMSFLLGGIDFVTILVSLIALFMWSLWACAACLFLSTAFRSRAMSGLVFGGVAIALLFVLVIGRSLMFAFRFSGGISVSLFSATSDVWWGLAIMASSCLMTMLNLVLLAENRLSLATENRVTALRVGFLAQFLLILGWTLSFINGAPAVRSDAIESLGVAGGLHLALVAMFVVTEDLVAPRRVLLGMKKARWGWLKSVLLPGGGRGALYVLTQMSILLVAAATLGATWMQARWLLAICGYICCFTGVPTFAVRLLAPERTGTLYLRVTILVLLPLALVLPDLIHYIVWQPESLSLRYSARHLLNPLRTLANWHIVERQGWLLVPLMIGVTGMVSYIGLIHLGNVVTAEAMRSDSRVRLPSAGESGSADVVY
jgi:hypothetical protein